MRCRRQELNLYQSKRNGSFQSALSAARRAQKITTGRHQHCSVLSLSSGPSLIFVSHAMYGGIKSLRRGCAVRARAQPCLPADVFAAASRRQIYG
jgi:hypothetical protein